MKPPKLPSEVLRRVLKVARFDGISVVVIAGLFALISAGSSDVSGAFFGALITAAGAIELRGVALLRASKKEGMQWLIASQLYLMTVVLIYVSFKILNIVHDSLITGVTNGLKEAGLDMDQLPIDLQQVMRTAYFAVAAVTVIYQGGMALYYARRRATAEAALAGPTGV